MRHSPISWAAARLLGRLLLTWSYILSPFPSCWNPSITSDSMCRAGHEMGAHLEQIRSHVEDRHDRSNRSSQAGSIAHGSGKSAMRIIRQVPESKSAHDSQRTNGVHQNTD